MSLTALSFQLAGVDWLTTPTRTKQKPHKMLADEMGLGKTVQACLALRKVKAQTALIICPASIKRTWARMLVDWSVCRADQIQVVNGKTKCPITAPYVIINYEITNDHYDALAARWYDALILDEAQYVKATDSIRSGCILGRRGKNLSARCWWKWALTGTPIPNRPFDAYPILRSWVPEIIDNMGMEQFGKYYCNGYVDGYGGWNFQGASHTTELRDRLAEFMLRRTIDEVLEELPPVFYSTVYMDIGSMAVSEKDTPLATLRKEIGIKKLPHIVEYLKDRLQIESKIVVCAYHREVVEGTVKGLSPNAAKIYGGMTEKQKNEALAQFQHNARIKVLVVQIQSGGTGIDGMQTVCNNLVFAEPDWSHGLFNQMVGRLRRIGQQRNTHVSVLIAEQTLDETVLGTYWKKDKVVSRLLEPGTAQQEDDRKMTIEAKLDQIIELLSTIAGAEPAEQPQQAAPEAPKSGRGRKPQPPAATPTPPDAPAQSVKTGATGAATLEYKDVEKAAIACMERLIAQGGMTEGAARLVVVANVKATGVEKMAEIKPENYAAFIAACNNAKAPAAKDDALAGI